jgi:hypothetical protein
MGDELKISVIATGFDENYSGAKLYGTTLTRSLSGSGIYAPSTSTPTPATDDTPPVNQAQPQPAPVIATVDDTIPTKVTTPAPVSDTAAPLPTDPMDDEFDIPAFLRRK